MYKLEEKELDRLAVICLDELDTALKGATKLPGLSTQKVSHYRNGGILLKMLRNWLATAEGHSSFTTLKIEIKVTKSLCSYTS